MAYTINKFNGTELVVLEDGTVDTSTSLGLVGRNYVGYGEIQNENFVFLLENFANPNPPSRPVKGQTWFDSDNSLLHVYNGTEWNLIGSAVVASTGPVDPAIGTIWLRTTDNTLHIWLGVSWTFIGPEAVAGYGVTRARTTSLIDTSGVTHPVILLTINDVVIGIISSVAFTIALSNTVNGFLDLAAGLTLSSSTKVKGNLQGIADVALALGGQRKINGVIFDNTTDVTIKSTTTNKLIKGDYITGSDFDGSNEITWAVDASSSNIIGKVVVRNSQGGFAAGTITADLVGDVSGNVTSNSGTSTFDVIRANQFIGPTLSGNAFSSTKLLIARTINGVAFDGTANVTVTAAAETLSGSSINPSVVESNLTSVGTLTELKVSNAGLAVGTTDRFTIVANDTSNRATVGSTRGTLIVKALDNVAGDAASAGLAFYNSTSSISLGGDGLNLGGSIVPYNTLTDLGSTAQKFNRIYVDNVKGNSDTATLATRSTNLAGGGAGALPYQTAANTTAFLGIGSTGQILKAGSGNTLSWEDLIIGPLTPDAHISFKRTDNAAALATYNGIVPSTITVDATSNNIISTIVSRDSSGNFAAGTITAAFTGNLTGSVTGNASTATRLQTPHTINGVSFDGSSDITVTATDPTKLPTAGGTMSGFITLHSAPSASMHAANKSYVDSKLAYTVTYGNTVYSTAGYTNQVGSFNDGANYFDVFPPGGKSMANLLAFIPSIAVVHYAGGVDANDSIRCQWSNLGDRIRVWVQNTEQRSTPAANYLALWS